MEKKRILAIIVVLMLTGFTLISYIYYNYPPVLKFSPRDIFHSPRMNSFRSNIEYLSETIGSRPYGSIKNNESKEWLETKFYENNLKVQRFSKFESIVGILKGKDLSSDKLVVIGAHFDTVCYTEGANDNAGGVALVLEAAQILSQYSFQYSIYFICFNCEEDEKKIVHLRYLKVFLDKEKKS